jgi:hypothetical protein
VIDRNYRRLLLADPVDRPELSLNVVRLLWLLADPVDRPLTSRKWIDRGEMTMRLDRLFKRTESEIRAVWLSSAIRSITNRCS